MKHAHLQNVVRTGLNPDFIFTLTKWELLVKIAKGEIDATACAKKLINSGTGTNGKWAGFAEAARQWINPKKKQLVFDAAFVLDAWTEKTANGFIDYIKIKNGVLLTIDQQFLKEFDADDLEVKKARVEFDEIISRKWKDADDKK